MPQRRINDAQTEKLLSALQSLPYRQKLAEKLAQKENIKYASAMRRLQRYVTTGAEKRQFARAPLNIRRATVKQARRLPVPSDYLPKYKPQVRPKLEQIPLPVAIPYRQDIPPFPGLSKTKKPKRVQGRTVDNYDLRALLAYYDGDADALAIDLAPYGSDRRTAAIFELAAKGVDVMEAGGIGRVTEAVRDWFAETDAGDVQDIDDLSDYFRDIPEWIIEIMLEDLAAGDSAFSDWMDAARADGMVFRSWTDEDYSDLEDSEFWKVWRAAYARGEK